MFSKALLKQSCKANGLMWTIITLAVCFMLSCVMLISGSGNISRTKDAVEETIIIENINGSLKQKAVSNYVNASNGIEKFDIYFANNIKSMYLTEIDNSKAYVASTESWLAHQPKQSDYGTLVEYAEAVETWKSNFPSYTNAASKYYAYYLNEWIKLAPVSSSFDTEVEYQQALATWMQSKPTVAQSAFATVVKEDMTEVYVGAISDTTNYIKNYCLSIDSSYDENSQYYAQAYGSTMFVINPNNQASEKYEAYEVGSTPEDYDVESIVKAISASDLASWAQGNDASDVYTYINSSSRKTYRNARAAESIPELIAGSMQEAENRQLLLDQLEEYGVTEEKFNSFGYTYDYVKHLGKTSVLTYQTRLDYEVSLLDPSTFESEEAYNSKVQETEITLASDVTNTLLQTLPEEVSDAIKEIGQMDLYSLIVGSIFFKMAGLLLPIIYMIMVSNNLVAGQVDTGSMAYVLSTSTKREQVVRTQALYLISSLFLMFVCTTITSCICFSIVNLSSTSLSYGKLILMNLGAFLVLFAMSGINFLTSCWFDRSKRSMAIGGGLSMFFLVATMLGLFGSEVIPSVVRLSALNNFNYVSIITFFDSISIIEGTTTFIYKFFILLAIGLVGYVIGSFRFVKKDLPL